LRGLEFEDDGARDSGFFAGGVPYSFSEAADYRFGFEEEDVGFERIFCGDGLRRAVGLDGVVVDAEREFMEAHSIAAESLLKGGEIEGADVAHRADVDFGEAPRGYFADAGNALNGEWREEVEDFGGLDDEETVGLAPIGGNFGEELVGRDAG